MTLYEIDLKCPACGKTWHAATIDPSSWWGGGVTGHVIATQCYCIACGHQPPMLTVEAETQGELFA
jgi:hypothetical protein